MPAVFKSLIDAVLGPLARVGHAALFPEEQQLLLAEIAPARRNRSGRKPTLYLVSK
jgi:hypothetical protein